jgi:hypothetical protein
VALSASQWLAKSQKSAGDPFLATQKPLEAQV